MKEERISFPCGSLTLEGKFFPAGSGGPCPAVPVAHPHPQYGGSMDNNVTMAVAAALVESGISALLFNFRGVGRSQGSYGGGVAEQEDAAAALGWLEGNRFVDKDKIGLAGYSFGAGVVLPVGCLDPRVRALALVSPYLQGRQDEALRACTKPIMIVGGGRDGMISPAVLARYKLEAAGCKVVKITEGADHFWSGYENEMAGQVAAFFRGVFEENQGM